MGVCKFFLTCPGKPNIDYRVISMTHWSLYRQPSIPGRWGETPLAQVAAEHFQRHATFAQSHQKRDPDRVPHPGNPDRGPPDFGPARPGSHDHGRDRRGRRRGQGHPVSLFPKQRRSDPGHDHPGGGKYHPGCVSLFDINFM